MSDPGSSGYNSKHSLAALKSAQEPPSKKSKIGSSSSDPILSLYENLENLIYEEYSQQDWSNAILEKLRQESGRNAPNLFKIIKSALTALQNSILKKDRECAMLKNKLQSLQTKLAKQHEALEAPVKAAAAARANEVAIQNVKNESLLLTLEGVSFVKPFGKFDVSLYPSAIVLSSKKGEQYHVLLSDVDNLLRVESPTTKDEVVVLPLKHALTVGKTAHVAIAMKLKPKDSLSVSIPKSSGEFKGKTSGDLKAMCLSSGNCSQNIASLFGLLSEQPIDMENEAVFRSLSASRTCIICHYKASHGILWPLKSGLLFGLKPLLWLPAAQILKVDFIRSSRYFELVVAMRGSGGQTFNFEMIEIDEESALSRYCNLQKFGQRGGKTEALHNKEVPPSSKTEAADVGGMEFGESSDDSDFIMESSSASSIQEDYNSEVEETDAEDDAGSGSEGDDSEEETNENSGEDDPDANENGLDGFAVVSGSDSDS